MREASDEPNGMMESRLGTTSINKTSADVDCLSDMYKPTVTTGKISRTTYKQVTIKKRHHRAVGKNGSCNVFQQHTSEHRLRFLQDIFTTLVDSQWRWTIAVFNIAFLGSWFGFAVIWWLIALTHGDLEEDHLPLNQMKSNWTPCITSINSFTSAFMYSIETQHTTGYGGKAITEECPEAIFVLCIQNFVGLIIQALMVGIVFSKMTRSKLRTQTLQFSRNAVICQRDGHLYLMFRIGDVRKSHIIGSSVAAKLIHSKQTKEGDILNNFQTELSVDYDNSNGSTLFIWPVTIIHKIDEESPLYLLSASDMLDQTFEIVVILEGTIESTGQTTQARSSYLPYEVLWGHRFQQIVEYNKEMQAYEIDHSKFDNTIPVKTPLCSAAEIERNIFPK